ILRSAQPGINGLASGLSAVERTHETPNHVLQASIAIGIAIPVAQHHVMFGTKVVVAPVLGERQAVYEKAVAAEGCTAGFCRLRLARTRFSEERSPGACQR